MEKEAILSQVADTVTDEPIKIIVDVIVKEKSWKNIFKKRSTLEHREFVLKQITIGNMMRISKLLLKIDVSIINTKDLLNSGYNAIETHGDTLVEIVAIALKNTKEYPETSLIEFIKWNFNSEDLYAVFGKILQQMNVVAFMHTIISMKGLSVLESAEIKIDKNEVSP
jgi:hypothetical protein